MAEKMLPIKKILLAILFLLMLSGCIPETQEKNGHPNNTSLIESQPAVSRSQTPTPHFTKTEPKRHDLIGPTLLIQTGTSEYQLIDFGSQSDYAFALPDSNSVNHLAQNLSPGKTRLIFHIDLENIAIIDLATGKAQSTHPMPSNEGDFNPEQTLHEAQHTNPNLAYTNDVLLEFIKDAHSQSKRNLRWYQSDRYVISVLEGSPTGTNLYLQDLQTGNLTQLEDAPGLIESFWIGPNPERILVKKGYVFEPGVWEDDRYYLVDVAARTTQRLPLPEGVDNPSVSWITATTLGVIHQVHPIGGDGFTVIKIGEMETTLLIAGLFTHVVPFGQNYVIFQPGESLYSTSIQIRGSDGLIRHKKEPDESCSLTKAINSSIIVNCEHESLVMDEQLNPQPFSDPIYSLTLSPDGDSIILVTRPGEVSLLDSMLRKTQSLELAGMPFEVRWLPDETGFLYRTRGALYHYNFSTEKNRLLIESDLFSDYTNINAVWVNIQSFTSN